MSATEPDTSRGKLVSRVKDVLLRPSQTWDAIEGEPATVGGLYAGYVAPLAGIAAACGLIGRLVFGVGLLGVVYRPPLGVTVAQALTGFLVNLAGVYVLALVIDGLAPKFGGTRNPIQAFKLAAYSGTAAWVAGVFSLVPMLGWLAVVGAIYSLYLLYQGLPKLMKAPEDRSLPYFAVTIVVVVVLGMIIGAAQAAIGDLGGPLRMAHGRDLGTVVLPGKASIDIGRLEAEAKQAQAAVKQAQAGEGPKPLDPEALKGFLPASVAGFGRVDVSAGSGEVAGVKGSSAKASYRKGAARIKLSVTDIGAAGALAGLVGAFNVKSSEAANDHYEKVGKVEGRMTQEKYDRASRAGEYSMMVGDKFMVQAKGEGVTVDDLKAAVYAVDIPRLEAQAKVD